MSAYCERFPSAFKAVIESPIFSTFWVDQQIHAALIGEFVLPCPGFCFLDFEVGQRHDGNCGGNVLVTVNYTVSYRQITLH